MDLVMWFERPKKFAYAQRYYPEYVNIAIFDDNKNKRGEFEFRLKISSTSVDIDKSIIQGFEPVIKIIKGYQKCNLYISSPEDLEVMQFVVNNTEPKLLVGDFYLMRPFDWQFIYKGNPASKSPSRRARLSKMINIYKCDKFDNVKDLIIEREKSKIVVTSNKPAEATKNEAESKQNLNTNNTDNTNQTKSRKAAAKAKAKAEKQANGTIKTEDKKNVEPEKVKNTTSNIVQKFVSNRGIGKYHTLDCPWAAMIKEENRVYMTEEELTPNLKPCIKCINNMHKKVNQTIETHDENNHDVTQKVDNHEESKIIQTEIKGDAEDKHDDSSVIKIDEVIEKITIPDDNCDSNNNEVNNEETSNNSHDDKPNESKDINNKIPSDIGALGRQIIKICEAYDIYCAIYDSTAVILTAAGGWKFDYTDRPIKLYHQNYKSMNGTKENSEYHLQSGEFYSPIDAIAYIIKHDSKRIKMMLKDLK